MIPRVTITVAFVLAVVGLGSYWLLTRPTPEENALRGFFTEFRQGHYEEAQAFTVGDDFYKMAAATSVRDTDGTRYLIGDYFPENRSGILRMAIESYVRPHVRKWHYLSMDTQRLSADESVVTFRLEVAIRDYTTGNLFGDTHEGRVEGKAFMKRENAKWVVEKLELNLFSDGGLKLAPYLKQVSYD